MNSMVQSSGAQRSGRHASAKIPFARSGSLCGALLLLIHLSAGAQQPPADQGGNLTAEEPSNYEAAARQYQEFLAAVTPSTPISAVVQTRTRLATVLFMLHRYRESLEALEPLDFPTAGPSKSGATAAIPTQAWLVRGLDDLELNQLPEAIRSLRQVLALDETSGTARLALGDALARSGDLEEAAGVYRRELRRAPRTVDAWYKLGSAYEELAGEITSQFTRQDGNKALALQLTAEQSLDRGDYWSAAKALFPVIQRASSPDQAGSKPPASSFQPGLHAAFGTALLQLGYPRAAEREFSAELAQDPGCLPAEIGMAQIEALRSNWEAALDIFGRMIKLCPKGLGRQLESPPAGPLREAARNGHLTLPAPLSESRAGKLWSEWLASDGLESVPQLESAAGSCSTSPSQRDRMPGYWLSESCSTDLLNRLRAQANLSEVQRDKLVEVEYRLGDYEAAAEAGRGLQRKAPDDPWAYYWLAKSYSALAGTSFDKLAEVGPDSARVHEILARYHSERQQLSAARSEYEAALRLDPNLPDLHSGLGTVYWQSGDWARAEDELSKALELSPSSTVAAYELGDCFVQQHRWEPAVSPLERALSDPAVERRARLDLAKSEAELGDSAAAIKNLTLLAPGDADGEIHYRLATIYRKIGDTAKAQEAFAQSAALHKASDQLDQSRIEALERESGGSPASAPGSVPPQ